MAEGSHPKKQIPHPLTYPEAIELLYRLAPPFHQVGTGAYKVGLANTQALDAHFNHPHKHYHTIHVAGTNGKGSCSHTLAAILQASGLRVGLYTSPHLLDFNERIRVNGYPIPHERVTHFIEEERAFFEPLNPSFFEVTTALAFLWFAEQKVDVAVIEVGLGGRLDCTNIITPDLSIITNISLEHTALLGDTLEKIATEKAGIIKPHVPVVIGERHPDTAPVFQAQAETKHSPILFAEDKHPESTFPFDMQLKGFCQTYNARTILTATDVLRQQGYTITNEAIAQGFSHVCDMTGLAGRWQKLQDRPTVICDIGHNPGVVATLSSQLKAVSNTPHQLPPNTAKPLSEKSPQLHILLGFVNDKDIRPFLDALPRNATYHFTQPSVSRALNANLLTSLARCYGLQGTTHPTVVEAYNAILSEAAPNDTVFIGGSNFVVADLLQHLKEKA